MKVPSVFDAPSVSSTVLARLVAAADVLPAEGGRALSDDAGEGSLANFLSSTALP